MFKDVLLTKRVCTRLGENFQKAWIVGAINSYCRRIADEHGALRKNHGLSSDENLSWCVEQFAGLVTQEFRIGEARRCSPVFFSFADEPTDESEVGEGMNDIVEQHPWRRSN